MTMSCQSSTADSAASAEGNVTGAGEIMLFGVRVVVDSMRKSVSMNNLSQYEQPGAESNADKTNKDEVAAGYASADDAVPNTGASRERKRGWFQIADRLISVMFIYNSNRICFENC